MAGSKRGFVNMILKLGALALLFFSAQKSWAGFDFYQGCLAFQKKKFEPAAAAFAQALRRDPSNPEFLDFSIRNAWQIGVASKNKKWFESTAVFSEEFSRQMPYYGRAWLYRALGRLYLERLSGGKMDPGEWRGIKTFIERAREGERGSPWMGYMTAQLLVSEAPSLSPEEKRQALDWMKKSLSLHYPNQVSPYLEPALVFLWERFSDEEILKYVTPPEALSYLRLYAFMEQRHLWAGRDEIWEAALKASETSYIPQCRRAEKFLRKGDFERALFEFRAAFRMNPDLVRAKAGILICRRNLEGLEEEVELDLKQILEEEQEDLGNLLGFLGGVLTLTEDPYLRGLYSFRQNDFTSARFWLAAAGTELKYKLQRRYLAVSYWHLGEGEKALGLLKEALEEKEPDLRDLLLLEKWDPPSSSRILEKTGSLVTEEQPKPAWWGEEFQDAARLDRKGGAGLSVHLKPGKAVISIAMRAFADSKEIYPYLRVRLWDQDRAYLIAESYRDHGRWKTAQFPVQTTGGKRWLQIELLNGPDASRAAGNGPVLELGALEIEYQTGMPHG